MINSRNILLMLAAIACIMVGAYARLRQESSSQPGWTCPWMECRYPIRSTLQNTWR